MAKFGIKILLFQDERPTPSAAKRGADEGDNPAGPQAAIEKPHKRRVFLFPPLR